MTLWKIEFNARTSKPNNIILLAVDNIIKKDCLLVKTNKPKRLI